MTPSEILDDWIAEELLGIGSTRDEIIYNLLQSYKELKNALEAASPNLMVFLAGHPISENARKALTHSDQLLTSLVNEK